MGSRPPLCVTVSTFFYFRSGRFLRVLRDEREPSGWSGMIFCTWTFSLLLCLLLFIGTALGFCGIVSFTLNPGYREAVLLCCFVNLTPFCNWGASINKWGEIFFVCGVFICLPMSISWATLLLPACLPASVFFRKATTKLFGTISSHRSHQDVVGCGSFLWGPASVQSY